MMNQQTVDNIQPVQAIGQNNQQDMAQAVEQKTGATQLGELNKYMLGIAA